jgi:alginate O-acetyltransferase complex protein AlgI
MELSSPFFLFVFLPASLAVYWACPSRLRNLVLLVVSLGFCAIEGLADTLVVLLAIGGNYLLGQLLGHLPATGPGGASGRRDRVRRRGVLAAAVAFNLGLLVCGKYGVFAAHVPLGVSFVTFSMLSYVLDVYAGRVRAESNPLRFGVYVAMFPKLMAGPIARYRDLAGGLRRRGPDLDQVSAGMRRFVQGLAKKVLIANAIGPVVNEIFSLQPEGLTAGLAWLGAVGFALQIYFDFAGYSDMAIGLGKLFGFDFVENFDDPYASSSIGEFWQRWHISLSSWFRDYVFLALAYALSRRLPEDGRLGVRTEMWAYGIAALTTTVACGLWHGAAWPFVMWGAWHGLFLVFEHSRSGKRGLRRLGRPLRHVLTLLVILGGWVVFRSQTVRQAGQFLAAMAGLGAAWTATAQPVSVTTVLGGDPALGLSLGLLLALPWRRFSIGWKAWARTLVPAGRVRPASCVLGLAQATVLLALLVLCAMAIAGGSYNPFVYQQF